MIIKLVLLGSALMSGFAFLFLKQSLGPNGSLLRTGSYNRQPSTYTGKFTVHGKLFENSTVRTSNNNDLSLSPPNQVQNQPPYLTYRQPILNSQPSSDLYLSNVLKSFAQDPLPDERTDVPEKFDAYDSSKGSTSNEKTSAPVAAGTASFADRNKENDTGLASPPVYLPPKQ